MPTNTSELQLLKKEPATDGEDTFNIKIMMNDNWDKIDADAVTNRQHREDVTTNPHKVKAGQVGAYTKAEAGTMAQGKADTAQKNAIDFAKSFGLGSVASNISNTDLNALEQTGFYMGSSLVNSPNIGPWYFIINIKHNGVYKHQIAFGFTSPEVGKTYSRTLVNGAWETWQEQETTAGAQAKADAVKKFATDHGVGGAKQLLGGTDLNDLVEEGLYIYSSGTGLVNPPVNGAGYITVFNREPSNLPTQIFNEIYTNNIYIRSRTGTLSTDAWNNWQKFETTAGSQAKANNAEAAAINFVTDYGLGSLAKSIPTQTSPDELDKTGFYYGADLLNMPSADTYVVNHTRVSNTGASQVAYCVFGTQVGSTYTRTQASGVWQTWEKIATQEWVRSFGVGTNSISGVSDLNSAEEGGFYSALPSTLNIPNTAYFSVITMPATGSGMTQIAAMRGGTEAVYVRNKTSGTWGAWKELGGSSAPETQVGYVDISISNTAAAHLIQFPTPFPGLPFVFFTVVSEYEGMVANVQSIANDHCWVKLRTSDGTPISAMTKSPVRVYWQAVPDPSNRAPNFDESSIG